MPLLQHNMSAKRHSCFETQHIITVCLVGVVGTAILLSEPEDTRRYRRCITHAAGLEAVVSTHFHPSRWEKTYRAYEGVGVIIATVIIMSIWLCFIIGVN
jgi:hypothetical protein